MDAPCHRVLDTIAWCLFACNSSVHHHGPHNLRSWKRQIQIIMTLLRNRKGRILAPLPTSASCRSRRLPACKENSQEDNTWMTHFEGCAASRLDQSALKLKLRDAQPACMCCIISMIYRTVTPQDYLTSFESVLCERAVLPNDVAI